MTPSAKDKDKPRRQHADAKKAKPPGRAARPEQSAAAPSPFPPIADYAFLSDCHTGALVAPDGSIDWLCVPRFDAPSVFGSLLDREAGLFRLGPFGVTSRPTATTCPGTNVLVTTWKTPGGWLEVRDALTMGPTPHEDTITPHTRPPTDEDAEHMLVRTVTASRARSRSSWSASRRSTTAAPRPSGRWSTAAATRADATGAGLTIRLQTDLELGIEASRVRARHTLRPASGLRRAGLGRGAGRPRRRRRRQRADRRHGPLLASTGWAARARSPTTAGARRSSVRR